MREEDLKNAIIEAQRFIKAAKAVPTVVCDFPGMKKPSKPYIKNGLESAACRRASMDLTRALAVLRNKA